MLRLGDILESRQFPDGTYYYLDYEKIKREIRKYGYETREFKGIEGIAIYDDKEELDIILAVNYERPKVLLVYTDSSFGLWEDAVLTSDLSTIIIDDNGILVPNLFK